MKKVYEPIECHAKACHNMFVPKNGSIYCCKECKRITANEYRRVWRQENADKVKASIQSSRAKTNYPKPDMLGTYTQGNKTLSEKLINASKMGTTYAEMQKAESIRLYAKVEV